MTFPFEDAVISAVFYNVQHFHTIEIQQRSLDCSVIVEEAQVNSILQIFQIG